MPDLQATITTFSHKSQLFRPSNIRQPPHHTNDHPHDIFSANPLPPANTHTPSPSNVFAAPLISTSLSLPTNSAQISSSPVSLSPPNPQPPLNTHPMITHRKDGIHCLNCKYLLLCDTIPKEFKFVKTTL